MGVNWQFWQGTRVAHRLQGECELCSLRAPHATAPTTHTLSLWRARRAPRPPSARTAHPLQRHWRHAPARLAAPRHPDAARGPPGRGGKQAQSERAGRRRRRARGPTSPHANPTPTPTHPPTHPFPCPPPALAQEYGSGRALLGLGSTPTPGGDAGQGGGGQAASSDAGQGGTMADYLAFGRLLGEAPQRVQQQLELNGVQVGIIRRL